MSLSEISAFIDRECHGGDVRRVRMLVCAAGA